MFDSDETEFAIRGARGHDLFLRWFDAGQKRARFRCFGMVTGPGQKVAIFEPRAGRTADAMRALVAAAEGDPLLGHRLTLGDTSGWPRAGAGQSPLRLLLHLDFFRAWQMADLAVARLLDQLTRRPQSLPSLPAQIAGAIAPAYDFNRLDRGVELARLALPVLRARIDAPGFADDRPGNTGYALRMLGDLCLRAEDPDLALACFEAAIAAGDNPHRRRKAIEAAAAAGRRAAVLAHAEALAQTGRLPDDLARIVEDSRP